LEAIVPDEYMKRVLAVQTGLIPRPTHRPHLSDYLGRFADPTMVYLADMSLWREDDGDES
jgi:hypothetical protein